MLYSQAMRKMEEDRDISIRRKAWELTEHVRLRGERLVRGFHRVTENGHEDHFQPYTISLEDLRATDWDVCECDPENTLRYATPIAYSTFREHFERKMAPEYIPMKGWLICPWRFA